MDNNIPQDTPTRQPRNDFYVYILRRPDVTQPDGYIPFYVGKGRQARITQHEWCARTKATCKHQSCRVIRKVWREGGTICKEKVYEHLTEQVVFEKERELILYGRQMGWPLVNLTDGGDGISGYTYTPEQRQARSLITRSYTANPEIRASMGRANIGRHPSEATKDKRRQTLQHFYATHPEARQKKSDRSRQMWADPTFHARQKASMNTPEILAALSKRSTGRLPTTTKTYPGFVSPDGTIYQDVFNLAAFCRTHGLSKPKMCLVSQGKHLSHQGWTCYPPVERAPTYYHTSFQSPSGEVFTDIVSLSAFCREHDLQHSNMTLVAQGKQLSHKGWSRVQPLLHL